MELRGGVCRLRKGGGESGSQRANEDLVKKGSVWGKQSVSRRARVSRREGKEICGETERRGGAYRLYTGQLCLFFMRNEPKERQGRQQRNDECLSAICFVKEAGETTASS